MQLMTSIAPVFDLVPAKSGIKLTMLQPVKDNDAPVKSVMPRGSLMMQSLAGGGSEFLGYGIGVELLIGNIAANLHQTVIDKTGLPGDAAFDFVLKYTPKGSPDSPQNGNLPSLHEALDQQLGLHLQSTRGPVMTVVVDHVDKPAAN